MRSTKNIELSNRKNQVWMNDLKDPCWQVIFYEWIT
jgi:hypothetical protein